VLAVLVQVVFLDIMGAFLMDACSACDEHMLSMLVGFK
jgi:hypothetical protein